MRMKDKTMDFLRDGNRLRVFITFIIIYIYFMHWSGGVSDSYYYLTRAIVDDKKLIIDDYASTIVDRAVYENHYYSNKAPGLSLLSTLPYMAVKGVFKHLQWWEETETMKIGPTWYSRALLDLSVVLTPFGNWSRIMLTACTSALASAVVVVLVYEILKSFTSKRNSLLIAGVGGLATPLFQESIVFRNHATTTMLIFLSFYVLFKSKEGKTREKHFLVAGLLMGLSMVFAFQSALAFIVIMVYVMAQKRAGLVSLFLLATLVSYTPMLYYNHQITGDPLHYVGVENNDVNIFSERLARGKDMAFDLKPNIYIIYRQLFGPYKGLFFYYPILLLSLMGLLRMLRTHPWESFVVAGMLGVYVMKFSTWYIWFGTSSPVSRFLTPAVPFLALPLAFQLKHTNKKLLILLITISLLNNVLALQSPEFSVFQDKAAVYRPEYEAIMNSFKPLKYPLLTYYLPLTLSYGPRAPLVEHLARGYTNIDIRDHALYQPRLPPFVNLIPLALILILVWRRKVFDRRGNSWSWWARLWGQRIAYAISVLAGILTAYIILMMIIDPSLVGEDSVNLIFSFGFLFMGFFIAYILYRLSKMLDVEGVEAQSQSSNR